MKFVYQAVHMIFNGDFDDEWEEGEKRNNKLVFIGLTNYLGDKINVKF